MGFTLDSASAAAPSGRTHQRAELNALGLKPARRGEGLGRCTCLVFQITKRRSGGGLFCLEPEDGVYTAVQDLVKTAEAKSEPDQ